jgi:hypothetical protein
MKKFLIAVILALISIGISQSTEAREPFIRSFAKIWVQERARIRKEGYHTPPLLNGTRVITLGPGRIGIITFRPQSLF